MKCDIQRSHVFHMSKIIAHSFQNVYNHLSSFNYDATDNYDTRYLLVDITCGEANTHYVTSRFDMYRLCREHRTSRNKFQILLLVRLFRILDLQCKTVLFIYFRYFMEQDQICANFISLQYCTTIIINNQPTPMQPFCSFFLHQPPRHLQPCLYQQSLQANQHIQASFSLFILLNLSSTATQAYRLFA